MILISSFIGQYLWGGQTRIKMCENHRKSLIQIESNTKRFLTDFPVKSFLFQRISHISADFVNFLTIQKIQRDLSRVSQKNSRGSSHSARMPISAWINVLSSRLTFLFLIRVTMVQFGGDFSPYLIFLG